MGFWKNILIKNNERYFETCNKMICLDCLCNKYLKKNNECTTDICECEYCHLEKECICVDEYFDLLSDAILDFYEPAGNVLPYDTKEGGFWGAEKYNSYDLIYDELYCGGELFDKQCENSEPVEDIVSNIYPMEWCKKDPFGLKISEEMMYNWKDFCNIVIKKNRDIIHNNEFFKLFDAIIKNIMEFNSDLIITINSESEFFRARQLKDNFCPNVSEFAAPPIKFAKSNRMSAEGISVFYCSDDKNVSLNEVDKNNKYGFGLCTFLNSEKLTILDLTSIDNIKFFDFFDKENRKNNDAILFLKDLNRELTKEITEPIYYIPTQIFAAYVRNELRNCNVQINGIAYSSSKTNSTGKNYVLFYDHLETKNDKQYPNSFKMKGKKIEMFSNQKQLINTYTL